MEGKTNELLSASEDNSRVDEGHAKADGGEGVGALKEYIKGCEQGRDEVNVGMVEMGKHVERHSKRKHLDAHNNYEISELYVFDVTNTVVSYYIKIGL